MSDLHLPANPPPPDHWPDPPAPQVFERDPKAIEARMIARDQALAGKPLQPARLMINMMAYKSALLRAEAAAAARTTIRFSIAEALGFPAAIPAGSRVTTAGRRSVDMAAVANDKQRRPLTDNVRVTEPVEVAFTVASVYDGALSALAAT